MIFTVVWTEEALEELARIWIRSNRQPLISDASNTFDEQLRTDAHLKGAQKGRNRVMIIRPLAISYHVNLDDRLVRVLSIAEETN